MAFSVKIKRTQDGGEEQDDAALDELLTGKSPEEIVEAGGVLKQLTKAPLERVMGPELSNHSERSKPSRALLWGVRTHFALAYADDTGV